MSLAPAADAVLRILVLLARQAEPVPAATVATGLGPAAVDDVPAAGCPGRPGFRAAICRRSGATGWEWSRSSWAPAITADAAAPDRPADAEPAGHRDQENAHLAVLHGPDVYYVIEQRAPRRRALVSDVGVRLPATLTASGMAILSALPAAQVRAVYPDSGRLVQRDGRGPTTLRELRVLLGDVRERGYAVEDGLVTAGLASVGVPVLDQTGHPVAGVSVTFEADRVDSNRHDQLVSDVRRAAATLTRRLGG